MRNTNAIQFRFCEDECVLNAVEEFWEDKERMVRDVAQM